MPIVTMKLKLTMKILIFRNRKLYNQFAFFLFLCVCVFRFFGVFFVCFVLFLNTKKCKHKIIEDEHCMDFLLKNKIMDIFMPIIHIRLLNEKQEPITPKFCRKHAIGQECQWSNNKSVESKTCGQFINKKLPAIDSTNLCYVREEKYHCKVHNQWESISDVATKVEHLHNNTKISHNFHRIGNYYVSESACQLLWRQYQKPGGYFYFYFLFSILSKNQHFLFFKDTTLVS